jgi:hypothetical protein
MNNIYMFILILCGLLLIPTITVFNRKLLCEWKFFKWVLLISIIMFIIPYICWYLLGSNEQNLGAFRNILLSLLIFRLLRKIFIKIFSREWEDTFWAMRGGVWFDSLFNIIYWFLNFIIFLFMVLYIK